MERLERVVEAGGCLLKVDQLGGKGAGLATGFLLTFDVGRLLIEVGSETGKIRSVAIEAADQVPAGAETVSEEEPWWRLLGSPLARVGAGEVAAQGFRLQFRADHENPRIIVLEPSGSEVQVTLEPTSRS